jgi:hypothetical protein
MTSDIAKKALETAITQIGQEEKPRGSNWGKPVSDYLASVGINFPASWCMAFVHWNFNRAAYAMGVNNPLPRSGGVLTAWHMAGPVHKIYRDYQPGDIFIQDHGHGLGHTGIIESIEGDIAHTIEGNTNDTGGREGYEVCRRTRKITSFIGVLRY